MEHLQLISDLVSLAEIIWAIGGAAIGMFGWSMPMIHRACGSSLTTWPALPCSSSVGIRFASTPNLRINFSCMSTGGPRRASHPSGSQPPIMA